MIVYNPSRPVIDKFRLDLEDQFTLGHQEDENYIFERVNHIALDNRGNIYILDSKNCQIKVFSHSGRHVNTIGRIGQGPGEFPEEPFGIQIVKDFIYVLFINHDRIDKFDLQGTYLKSIKILPYTGVFYIDSKENIFAESAIWDEKGEARRIAKIKNNKIIKEYSSFRRLDLRSDYLMFRSDKGMLVYGRKNEYKFFITDDKDLNVEVNCEVSPIPYSEEEKREHLKNIEKIPPTWRKDYTLPPFKPFISWILIDDFGWIWVVREGVSKDLYFCDIFDSQGRYIYRTSQLSPEFVPKVIKGEFIYTIYEDDETGNILIKKFKIKNWPPSSKYYVY
ncbi:MAG: 6-bladed beta-propeller [Acidobacteriota bacterium]